METFENILLPEARCNYDKYILVSKQVLGLRVEVVLKKVEWGCTLCTLNLTSTNSPWQ